MFQFFVTDHVNQEAKLIKYTEFYNESLNGFIDFMDDFKRFRERTFSLCNFPFVLTVATKANILKLESSVLMREKLQVNVLAHQCRFFLWVWYLLLTAFVFCLLNSLPSSERYLLASIHHTFSLPFEEILLSKMH